MSFTDSVYILIFTSGFFGGFGHCIGMCGPLVTATAFGREKGSFVPLLLFHLGRVLSYSIVGDIMGFSGSFSAVARSIAHFQNLAMALAGMVMISLGLRTVGLIPRLNPGRKKILSDFLRRISGQLSQEGSSSFPLGIIVGFIPCGLSYTAYIAAAGAGAAAGSQVVGLLRGMIMLFLFGIGTIPALFLISQLAFLGGERLRNSFLRAYAVLMMMIGALFIYRAVQY